MKATGIVRRIDDLGRVVIPKEIRRTLRIKEGDPLEIFTDREGEVILKKYSPIGEISSFAQEYADAMSQSTGHTVLIVDRDQVVAAAGIQKKQFSGKSISKELEMLIQEREKIDEKSTSKNYVKVTEDDENQRYCQILYPILAEGDAIGAVLLIAKDEKMKFTEAENLLAKCAAGFLGKQFYL